MLNDFVTSGDLVGEKLFLFFNHKTGISSSKNFFNGVNNVSKFKMPSFEY